MPSLGLKSPGVADRGASDDELSLGFLRLNSVKASLRCVCTASIISARTISTSSLS